MGSFFSVTKYEQRELGYTDRGGVAVNELKKTGAENLIWMLVIALVIWMGLYLFPFKVKLGVMAIVMAVISFLIWALNSPNFPDVELMRYVSRVARVISMVSATGFIAEHIDPSWVSSIDGLVLALLFAAGLMREYRRFVRNSSVPLPA